MRKTLTDRLAERVKDLDGDLVDMLRNDCTAADELAAMEDALRVWAEANSAEARPLR